jgi:hypothetical protein
MAEEEKKNILERIFGKVDSGTVIRGLWGAILPHLGPLITEQTRKRIASGIPDERLKGILASVAGTFANLLEKGGGLYREILSDIFENLSYGLGRGRPGEVPREAPPESKPPSLETLRVIKQDTSIQNKRIFLETFISPPLRDKIKEIKDEDVDLFIDTLIRIQELHQEIQKEFKVEVPLRELWSGIREGFSKLYEALREKYPEAKEAVKKQRDEFLRGFKEGWQKGRKKGLL